MENFNSKRFNFCLLIMILNIIFINSVIVPLEPKVQQMYINTLKKIRNSKILKYEKEISSTPKVSIVIPVLNGASYITPLMVSIQSQELEDIEIIFVDDFSTDNTYKYILKAQKLDPRIKIIKNQKNMGIMYSRMFGALESKGEYVTFLDCDDLYIEPKILKTAYETAEEKDLDIIQYEYVGGTFENGDTYNFLSGFVSKEEYYKIKRKPEVKKILFGQRESQGGSGIVYDKLYSRNLIKKMGLYLGEDLIYKHLIFMEDFLISFGAFRCADNFMLMKMFGVWHWHQNPNGMTSKVSQVENDEFVYPEYSNKKIGDYLFIWEKMFDMTENEPDDGLFRLNILYILYVGSDIRQIFSYSYHFERLLNLCRRFFKWKYLTLEVKIPLLQYCRNTIELSIPMKKKYSLFYDD